MGCSESRGNQSEEEVAIRNGEISLGYDRNPSRQYDLVFKSHSNEEGKINKARFVSSLKALNLNTTGVENVSSKIGEFYAKMATFDQYNCEQLVLLGIMLSGSKKEDVVDVFHSHLDTKCVNKVKKEEFNRVLDIMITVACDYCTSLGVGAPNERMLPSDRM